LVGLLALTAVVCAQRRVDPRNTYTRVICVVPFTGKGTPADPKRPAYAPWPPSRDVNGIVAFYYLPTDDGQSAVVEFAARSRAAFQSLLNDSTITVFELGQTKRSDVETAIRKSRRDFDLEKFGLVMP
jgi:hypothetical protein